MKAALFDADGVVIDAVMFSVQYQKDFDIPKEDMLPFFEGRFKDCLTGNADLMEVIEPWLEGWNWNGSAQSFLDYWFKVEDKPDEKVIKRIERLKTEGISCYLATNQEKYRTEYIREQMGFGRIFDKIYSSAYIGFMKPDKRFFRMILDDLGIQPEDMLYFDDSPKHVDSARELGIRSVLVDNKGVIGYYLDRFG